MTVKVATIITSGFSFEDAEKITPALLDALREHDEVVVDFDGVKYFTTLFFSQSLTYLVGKMGEDSYRKKIKTINLTESGADTYKHALDYAIDYYAKNLAGREMQDSIIETSKKEV